MTARLKVGGRSEYCGLFRTPTLRNVALKKSFLHNGYFHSLRDVVSFYGTRDSDPGRWYPRNADGTVRRYDDLRRPIGTISTRTRPSAGNRVTRPPSPTPKSTTSLPFSEA